MRIELNGEPRELAEGRRVGERCARAAPSRRRRGVAVALDGEVVPRGEWEATTLREGQSVEVAARRSRAASGATLAQRSGGRDVVARV